MNSKAELLIERWLPIKELGIESVRERAVYSDLPATYALHTWWARRPLVASAGAVLASLLPSWSEDLSNTPNPNPVLLSERSYHDWFIRLCGILGDPVVAHRQKTAADASGVRLPVNPFDYGRAFKVNPEPSDLALLHDLMVRTWGKLPTVLDPTAGGGSIPFEAVRYGLPAIANDLNGVAAAVLKATIEVPLSEGGELTSVLETWGEELKSRLTARLAEFFPPSHGMAVKDYIWARTVACPRTGKTIPLVPNWWLSKGKNGVAVLMVTERDGVTLDEPEFQILKGDEIDVRRVDAGTITRGKAVSPWDSLVVDADYIKKEAQEGRMGELLYALAVDSGGGRDYVVPTDSDLAAVARASAELRRLMPTWEAQDVLPNEAFPDGNDMRPVIYGMPRWRDMFTDRQLLVHGTYVDEFRKLIPEVRASGLASHVADAVLGLFGLMVGKAVPWNCKQTRWNPPAQRVSQAFDQHAYPFRWSFAEIEGAVGLYGWVIDGGLIKTYREIVKMLGRETNTLSTPLPGTSFTVSQGSGGNMPHVATGSVELVCIDPPYYDNVMYAELADFFYVWEKRTVGLIWPEFFEAELSNKEDEAVSNTARFAYAGRRKNQLAALDYQNKMTAIFLESHRVLVEDGILTVMFTHKKSEAWDSLGQGLLEAGFTIESSWPVRTERQQALQQLGKNAAASTIYLVCRKRSTTPYQTTYFEAIEAEVRLAARNAHDEMTTLGLSGVDLLLATYGPTLSVLSEHWPVYSSEPGPDGQSRLLRPDEALLVAQEEVVRLQKYRLVGQSVEFDPLTDFWLLAWDTFRAREFPFDEARKLALAVGGTEVDEAIRAKLLSRKSGEVVLQKPGDRYRRDPESTLPGVNRERVVFPALIDTLHTALYVIAHDGAAAGRHWLDQRQLTTDSRFRALTEASLAAVPRIKDKGEFTLAEAALLERLVVAAFPDIPIPPDESVMEQERLFDE